MLMLMAHSYDYDYTGLLYYGALNVFVAILYVSISASTSTYQQNKGRSILTRWLGANNI